MDARKIAQPIVAISAVGALLVSAYNSVKINEVHVLINSRLSELLTVTKDAANAQGRLEGRALEKQGK